MTVSFLKTTVIWDFGSGADIFPLLHTLCKLASEGNLLPDASISSDVVNSGQLERS